MRDPIELQEALTPGFDALVNAVTDAGWTEQETLAALLDLALAQVLAMNANADTDAAIKEAVARIHGLR